MHAPSVSNQYVVWRSLLYGSYSYPTAERGDHLAWYFAIPYRENELQFSLP